ncbi:MAG TPA: glycosyltransferase family 2 protein [Chthonomonadaceae bacterium]|nr:glycosyltransferase family 2 protein [Chthonomonadaceae bacterium]
MALECNAAGSPTSAATTLLPMRESEQADTTLAQATASCTLSVLLPIYNERATLLTLLERIRAVPVEKEILIVDDASTDGTRALLRSEVEGKYPEVRVFYQTHNQGKGAALRAAIPHATGAYCIVQDGDLEYDPQDYLTILRAFQEQNADVVYGSRFLRGWPKMRPANKLINILLAWMVRIFFRTPMTDEATCYKAFRTDVLSSLPLTCRRFEFCPEVTAKVIRRGHRIVEVPIRYEARSMAQGKKIRWTDGLAAIWTLLKFRFARF